jgi:signal peptidase I
MRRTAVLAGVAAAAVMVAVVANAWLVTASTVTSESMAPTLAAGDVVAVLRASDVGRGDIVLVDPDSWPDDAHGADGLVKRVVGLPGDRVTVRDGQLSIDGARVSEPYAGDAGDVDFDVVVPEGKLWLMGDNRGTSRDSRAYLGSPGGGFVSQENVEGKAVAILWPPGRARTVGES